MIGDGNRGIYRLTCHILLFRQPEIGRDLPVRRGYGEEEAAAELEKCAQVHGSGGLAVKEGRVNPRLRQLEPCPPTKQLWEPINKNTVEKMMEIKSQTHRLAGFTATGMPACFKKSEIFVPLTTQA